MDRGEPTLVPEWLKNNGSSAGGGGSSVRQPFFSSSSRSDDHSAVKHAKSVSSANSSATASDRATAAYFHRSSSVRGSSHLQSYSSFGRSNRNGVYEDSFELHDKEKLTPGVHRDSNQSDHFGGGLQRKFHKDKLQRSQSMNGWRDEDTRRRISSGELSNGRNNNHSSGNVLLGKGSGTNKTNTPSFEQDFPSLLSEDLRVGSDIGRVPSPGFQRQLSAISDGWTSALAEAPGVNGNGSPSSLASTQVATGISAPLSQNTAAPNMAEAVAQIPARARTPPELQLSVNSQRLEELAIKKSKQLIPMTPTMPRSHMTSSLEKSKTRIVQPQGKSSPSYSGTQAVRAGPSRLDAGKLSHPSKLQILKPSKDLNGGSAAGKESLGSPNGVSVPPSPLSVASSTAGSPGGNPFSHQSLGGFERKPAVVSTILEKKPSLQAQSRNDFFNHLKKKSSSNNSPVCNDDHSLSTTLLGKSDSLSAVSIISDVKLDVSSGASGSDTVIENGGMINIGGRDVCGATRHPTMNGEEQLFYPNEEEAAFMRSLGWEESAEDEGLTEEEINSFLKEFANSDLSSPCPSVQKMALQLKASESSCLGFSSAQSLSMPHPES